MMSELFSLVLTLFLSTALLGVLTSGVTLSCPGQCQCDQSTQVVNCSYQGLTTVPQDVPTYCKTLDLSNNHLSSLPPGVFDNLSALQDVDLSANNMKDGVVVRGTFDGVHQLNSLDFSYNTFTKVPKYLPGNITTFFMMYNQMVYLDDLSGLGYVRRLDLSNNVVFAVDSHVFQNLSSLVQLDLEFNHLSSENFPSNALQPLVNLQNFGIRFNNLGEIPAHLPSSLVGLDIVAIDILGVEKGPLNHLKNLDNIAFWRNQVSHIDDGAFMGLTKLTLMDAQSNKISKLTNGTFKGLPSMRTLYLEENAIESIQPGAFDWFKAPEELWLGDNKLSTLDSSFLHVLTLPSISFIDVTFNPFVCDCHVRWLKVLSENSDVVQFPHLITCAGPPSLAGKAWDVLSSANFTCAH